MTRLPDSLRDARSMTCDPAVGYGGQCNVGGRGWHGPTRVITVDGDASIYAVQMSSYAAPANLAFEVPHDLKAIIRWHGGRSSSGQGGGEAWVDLGVGVSMTLACQHLSIDVDHDPGRVIVTPPEVMLHHIEAVVTPGIGSLRQPAPVCSYRLTLDVEAVSARYPIPPFARELFIASVPPLTLGANQFRVDLLPNDIAAASASYIDPPWSGNRGLIMSRCSEWQITNLGQGAADVTVTFELSL